MRQINLPQIGTIDFDGAFIVAVDALQQSGDGGFAGAAAADQPKHGAGGDFEAHLFQRRVLRAGIGEGDILEGNRAFKFWPQPGAGGHGFRRDIEHLPGDAGGAADFLGILDQLGHANQRRGDAATEHHEGKQAANADPGGRHQRDIGANQQNAAIDHAFKRRNQRLAPIGGIADALPPGGGIGGAAIPQFALLRLQCQ